MLDALKTRALSLARTAESMEDALRALENGHYGHDDDRQQRHIHYHPAVQDIFDPVEVVGHKVSINWEAQTFEGVCEPYSHERRRHWIVYNKNECREAEFVEIGPDDVIHAWNHNSNS